MSRARVLALVTVVMLVGCERRHEPATSELRLESLPADTAGLSRGEPLLTEITPRRESDGALHVDGRLALPDGVRIELSIYPKDGDNLVSRVQVLTKGGRFETPALLAGGRPVPHGHYRLEYRTFFTQGWQTDEVLRRTDNGRTLRGPGVTRDNVGGVAFYLIEERKL